MDLKLMFLLTVVVAIVSAGSPDAEFEDDRHFDKKERQVYVDGYGYSGYPYRRPLNLQIRVPFFQMFLRRQKTGPSNLGLQVFPDSEHGGLVNINHKWWGKK